MRHFLSTVDWGREQLEDLLTLAAELKTAPLQDHLRGKSVALMFLNPSLRTRTSFELGMQQLGGIAIVLQPGKDAWGVEFEAGAVMDGDAEEHIAEVAGVLSRYCDLIALRAFPLFKDWSADREDRVIRSLAAHASVPVINMETIVHPCQELALMLTLKERLGDLRKRKFLLTWTWHPRPLNTAVANSALLIASKFGMDVTLLCPEEAYRLDPQFESAAEGFAAAAGGSCRLTHDIEEAYAGLTWCTPRAGARCRTTGGPGGMGTAQELPPFHRRRRQNGPDERRPVQPLPAAAAERQGDRRRDGRRLLRGAGRGGESPARAEGDHDDPVGKEPVMKKIVLAFSGGLDTSYCVLDLVQKGFEVHTAFIDTGGVDEAGRRFIRERAVSLGAAEHHEVDAAQAIWDEFVIPLVWSHARMRGEYPLLCSDRYLIVKRCLELCERLGTRHFAHGCTGMGNDQLRFDQTVRSLGDYEIHAPIRDLQARVRPCGTTN
jgi:N-acetylornithine carbamoyltransferase